MSLESWARHNSTDTGATQTGCESSKDKPIRRNNWGILTNQKTFARGSGQSEAEQFLHEQDWSEPSENWNWISFQGKGNEDVWPDKWTFGWKNALQLHGLLRLLTIPLKQHFSYKIKIFALWNNCAT